MVTGPDGRGWTLRESFALDFKISRISHDFGTFKFLLKCLKSFKISKVATKKPVLFFSKDNHWQNVDLWADVFFCEFFRPNKMMDLLRPWQFQVSDFPFMAPSSVGFLRGSLLPGGQQDPSMWNGGQIFFPLPDSTFTKHGLPFHLQRHLCSICINGAFVGSKSVCSLVGTSCGTNIKHRKTRSGGAIFEKSCFCRPFGWFWGLETDFKPLKRVACFKSWNLKEH